MTNYLDECLAHTKRQYPDGYGFALAYLDDNLSPAYINALTDCALYAFPYEAKRGNPDALAFAKAYVEAHQCTPATGWRAWLVEAAQLCHAKAMSDGDALCVMTLRACGHPGF